MYNFIKFFRLKNKLIIKT